jgi:hypothetical protein
VNNANPLSLQDIEVSISKFEPFICSTSALDERAPLESMKKRRVMAPLSLEYRSRLMISLKDPGPKKVVSGGDSLQSLEQAGLLDESGYLFWRQDQVNLSQA